jgi:CRISPR-associated protein Cmr5
MKDLQRERAEFAFDCVETVKNQKKPDVANEYKSYVKKLPAMIQTNGLGATLAFMFSKKKTYKIIYDQLDTWLKERRKLKKEEELVRWIVEQDSSKYKLITNEVLALLLWLRRFADGMIEKQ